MVHASGTSDVDVRERTNERATARARGARARARRRDDDGGGRLTGTGTGTRAELAIASEDDGTTAAEMRGRRTRVRDGARAMRGDARARWALIRDAALVCALVGATRGGKRGRDDR